MNIQKNVDLSAKNTFRLNAVCRYFFTLESTTQLLPLLKQFPPQEYAIFILGGGSNVILPDFFDGLMIQTAIKGFQQTDKGEQVLLSVGAGEQWHDLIEYCLSEKLYGLENLTLIPGMVGAAPIQNIGAYGVEVEQWIDSVNVFDFSDAQFKTLTHAQCCFAYRNSIFKQQANRYLVLGVNFLLKRKTELNCAYQSIQSYLLQHQIDERELTQRQLSEIIAAIRLQRLPNPQQVANVGSFFKNPVVGQSFFGQQANLKQAVVFPQANGVVKVSAAWLIEQCGWKGKAFRALKVSDLHALVVENHGTSTQEDVLALAQAIQTSVKQRFGIELEIEPVCLKNP